MPAPPHCAKDLRPTKHHSQKAISEIGNKSILIVDDVIYKGTTMKLALDASSKQRPQKLHFLALGKSMRFAYKFFYNMAKIAGFKPVKNTAGKITHVLLSMKDHGEYLQNLIDLAEMEKARKGDTVPWEETRKRINKKFSFKD